MTDDEKFWAIFPHFVELLAKDAGPIEDEIERMKQTKDLGKSRKNPKNSGPRVGA